MYRPTVEDSDDGGRAFDQGKNYGQALSQAKNDLVGGCSGLFSSKVSWLVNVDSDYSGGRGQKWPCIVKIGLMQLRPM